MQLFFGRCVASEVDRLGSPDSKEPSERWAHDLDELLQKVKTEAKEDMDSEAKTVFSILHTLYEHSGSKLANMLQSCDLTPLSLASFTLSCFVYIYIYCGKSSAM